MGSFSRKLKKPAGRKRPVTVVSAVAELRQLMQFSKDLHAILLYFDDSLVKSGGFMGMGQSAEHPVLESLVLVALKVQLTDESPRQSQLIHVPEFQLWHGYLLFPAGLMVRVLYFEDMNRGLCSAGRAGSSAAHHIRFSIPEGVSEPLDPARAELSHFSTRPRSGEPS